MGGPFDPRTLTGINLEFRLIEPKDAAYVYALRMDPSYNLHLSTVSGTIKDQEVWITRYKEAEAQGFEYYFVINRIGHGPCGLVRLYDIKGPTFTWGSWILDHNKPAKAALESAVLIYRIAFEALGAERGEFEVMHENVHTIAFHQRFGARETGQSETHVQFDYSADQFKTDQPRYLKLIEESNQ